MRWFDAVIFDMDGVLIDSEPLHFEVLSELLAQTGHAYTRAENEQFIGTTSEEMFSTLIAHHGLAGSVAEYICALRRIALARTPPTPPASARCHRASGAPARAR